MIRYADADEIDSRASEAMPWAVEQGLMNGYGDGALHPWETATRAEVCTILCRFLDLT